MSSKVSRSSLESDTYSTSPGSDNPQSIPHTLNGFQELRDQIKKHLPFAAEMSNIESLIDGVLHHNSVDDRKMLLEHILVFLSKNSDSPKAKKLESLVIQFLYNDLPHPPQTYVGPDHSYCPAEDAFVGPDYSYRTADGSYNNVSIPDLGKAGTPYARTVQPTHALPSSDLPDPGLVFDTLLKREKFVRHPAGLSSLMFAFAAAVVHTVFRTSHKHVHINETSSYVDLAPLYGNDQETQDKLRVRDGRGLLKPDAFAEDRLLLLPPAVCVILVLFNRNHNFIARQLLQLNERGTYKDPNDMQDDTDRMRRLNIQDEDIFQTARLINCGWFGAAVFADYVAAILGLVRQGSSWSLNPFEEVRNIDHSLFERGRGNVCSVEFNCLYRWHATTSQNDEKWVEQLLNKLFKDKSFDELTPSDLKRIMEEDKLKPAEADMSHWTFGSLQRDEKTGAFNDKELADILKTATDQPAGAFKARGTPHVMRVHEIMGIEANRKWGVCSLNEFRKYLGLKTYSNFLEWNSDPEVASAAEKLYGDIDRLELYAGLQAEEAKPVVDGAGLCPSYTISRAILGDAIALTRGDRFFTSDYTPSNMTAWGFSDCQRDPDGPGNGSMLGRLILRTLPGEFTNNSTYAWFPLMTPTAMERILASLGQSGTYDLARPRTIPEMVVLSTYGDVQAVLRDDANFGTGLEERIKGIVHGPGFFMASNDPPRAAHEQREMMRVLCATREDKSAITRFFFEKTRELIVRESAWSVGTSVQSVDLVTKVFRHVPIYWVCELTGIRLKTHTQGEGDYTPSELFSILADIYTFLWLDVPPEKVPKLRRQVTMEVNKLLALIRRHLGAEPFSLSVLMETISQLSSGPPERDALMERVRQLHVDADTQCNMVLAFLVSSTVELSQAMINVMNFYLGPSTDMEMTQDQQASSTFADAKTLTAIQALMARSQSGRLAAEDEATLQGYVLESLRLNPTSQGVYREVLKTVRLSQGPLKAKQRIFVDFSTANTSMEGFEDPAKVNPSRGFDKYLVIDGGARCLGLDLSSKMVAHAIRAVYSFKNVKRAPGQSGILKRHKDDSSRTSNWVYLQSDMRLTPWATSMFVQYKQ